MRGVLRFSITPKNCRAASNSERTCAFEPIRSALIASKRARRAFFSSPLTIVPRAALQAHVQHVIADEMRLRSGIEQAAVALIRAKARTSSADGSRPWQRPLQTRGQGWGLRKSGSTLGDLQMTKASLVGWPYDLKANSSDRRPIAEHGAALLLRWFRLAGPAAAGPGLARRLVGRAWGWTLDCSGRWSGVLPLW